MALPLSPTASPPPTLTGSGAEWAPFMLPILNPNTSVSFCGRLFVSRERGEVALWGGGGEEWGGEQSCVCVNVPNRCLITAWLMMMLMC